MFDINALALRFAAVKNMVAEFGGGDTEEWQKRFVKIEEELSERPKTFGRTDLRIRVCEDTLAVKTRDELLEILDKVYDVLPGQVDRRYVCNLEQECNPFLENPSLDLLPGALGRLKQIRSIMSLAEEFSDITRECKVLDKEIKKILKNAKPQLKEGDEHAIKIEEDLELLGNKWQKLDDLEEYCWRKLPHAKSIRVSLQELREKGKTL